MANFASFVVRWITYRDILLGKLHELKAATDKLPIEVLERHLKAKCSMLREMEFVDPSSTQRCNADVSDTFWKCLLFRPDVAHEVSRLLADPEIGGRQNAGFLLKSAIDWPADFW